MDLFNCFMLTLPIYVFFSKSAVDPKYCLLFVDLFTQKIYTYPMRKRNILKKKMEEYYEEVSQKRKEKNAFTNGFRISAK